ncbi:MAG: cysteine desulfurase family protein [Myxococcota bacterium]
MIYLDHNASTPLRPQVAELLVRAVELGTTRPGNSSSVHQGGRAARARIDAARISVAKTLGCEMREVCFTASGSEGDALALQGAFRGRKDKARRGIVSSRIEHPAVLTALDQLEADGAKVTRLSPRADGRVDVEKALAALSEEVALCSLMWANNETGVLQPVAEVARECRRRGILFHTDAVQATGKVPVSLREVDADLLTISAHKLGGPAGVGALVVRKGVELFPLVPGHQEDGRRGGTHNVAYIEALALALELAAVDVSQDRAQGGALRDRLERELLARIPDTQVNGSGAPRVPNTTNVRFEGADGEALLIALDLEGICVSTGAACASGSLSPSHVLTAMGLSSAQAHASLRISLGTDTTEAEIDRVIDALVTHVPKAREATTPSPPGRGVG